MILVPLCLLILLSISDIKTQYIPINLTMIFLLSSFIYLLTHDTHIFERLLLIAVILIVLYILAYVFSRIMKQDVLGEGDYFIIAGMMAVTPISDLFFMFNVSFISAGFFGCICLLLKIKKSRDYLPFVPFLTMSMIYVHLLK